MLAMRDYLEKRLPEISQHLENEEIELIACFSQYFITLFLYDTPTNIGLRIFDVFLLEGERVLFELLYKMLDLKKEKILLLTQQDLLFYLRKKLVKECFEEFSLSTLFSSRKLEDFELDALNN